MRRRLWILTILSAAGCGGGPTGPELDEHGPQDPLHITGQVLVNGIPRPALVQLRYANSGVEGCLPSGGGCYGHWSVDTVTHTAATGPEGRFDLAAESPFYCVSPYHSLEAVLDDTELGEVPAGSGAIGERCGRFSLDIVSWYSRVSGVVRVDGEPVAAATVRVHHGESVSTTTTGTDEASLGTYRLVTYAPFEHETFCDASADGAFAEVTLPDGRVSEPVALSAHEADDCELKPFFAIDFDLDIAGSR